MQMPKPKYRLGQEVFLLQSTGIKSMDVHEVHSSITLNGRDKVRYKVATKGGPVEDFSENRIFGTKVDAAYAWLKDQRLDASQVLQGFLNI